MTAQALNQRSASPTKTQSSNEKYTFRVWLLRLGMIGDEFKTARQHLLDHLEGCIAWKDPAQAQRQKERLREKREAERQQTQAPPEEVISETEMEAEDEQSPAFTMSMICYSTDPREGYLTKQGIRKMKSALANEIFRQELIPLYREKTQRRDALKEQTAEVMDRIAIESSRVCKALNKLKILSFLS